MVVLLGRVPVIAQRPLVVKLSRKRSVGRSVCLSVQCIVEKRADRIRMPFGIIRRMGSGMRQVVGFGDRSTGKGTFVGEFGARHCNQWGLNGVRLRQRRDAVLFPNYFGQTCYSSAARKLIKMLSVCVCVCVDVCMCVWMSTRVAQIVTTAHRVL